MSRKKAEVPADEASTEAPPTEETEEAPAEKKPVVREVAMKDERIAPKEGSRKRIMFDAGATEEGALFSDVAASMGTTESNIRQHLTQCTALGFGIKTESGRYWILGEPTITQEEINAKKKAEKEAAKPAEEVPADDNEAEEQDSAPEGEGDDFLS